MEIQELKKIASQVRRDIVRMVHSSQSGHPGGSLGCTDVVVSLYFDIMKINEEKGEDGFLKFSRAGQNEDLFFFQMGIFLHYFILYYQEGDISLLMNWILFVRLIHACRVTLLLMNICPVFA